jgi:transcription initiation factor IIE alpha subunit
MKPKPVYSSPCSKCGSPLDVRTALEVQKEQETTDQIMNKLFENKKFRNAVEQALRVLK